MRSNIGVGLPIDLAIARRDALAFEVLHRIEPGEPYFHDLSERWSAAPCAPPTRAFHARHMDKSPWAALMNWNEGSVPMAGS